MRELFAGLAPARGLAPGAGTSVYASEDYSGGYGFGDRRYVVELAGGTLLAGDFLPSRKRVVQVLAVERAERARLDVRPGDTDGPDGPDGPGLVVDNNLGVAIEALFVRDPRGELHRLASRLEPGASATLAVVPRGRAEELDELLGAPVPLTPGRPAEHGFDPPGGCYVARLASGPFRDDCGIETNELAGSHTVLGVLPLDAEIWR
jgi:hypothetical protein